MVGFLEVVEHGLFHFIPGENQHGLLKLHLVALKLRSHLLELGGLVPQSFKYIKVFLKMIKMRYSYSLFLGIRLCVGCNSLNHLYLFIYIVLNLSKGWNQPLKV